MSPPTKREQLALDELLSDIYKGIETLPDNKQQYRTTVSSNRRLGFGPVDNSNSRVYQRSQVKEYELPADSPIVKQHKQEVAALRENPGNRNLQYYEANSANNSNNKQPQRSTLKRRTNEKQTIGSTGADNRTPQSLADFVTNDLQQRQRQDQNTPDTTRRRVRIIDHPDKSYNSEDYYQDNEQLITRASNNNNNNNNNNIRSRGGDKVKYVNTNKLIYHEEKNPYDDDYNDDEDDEYISDANQSDRDNSNTNNRGYADDDEEDEDIDGVTRVEYYHTTWLDRQLGRASKRRSSKELNERQVKEKAMIEELKRSLKNGAITLKKSLRGKKNNNKNKYQTVDDQMLNNRVENDIGSNTKRNSNNVIGSGLATIPRNRLNNSNSNNLDKTKNNQPFVKSNSRYQDPYNIERVDYRAGSYIQDYSDTIGSTPKQTDYQGSSGKNINSYNNLKQQQQQPSNNQPVTQNNYSKTLPHNYNQSPRRSEHQLLQSHYRQPLTSRQQTTSIPNQQIHSNTLQSRSPNYPPASTSNTQSNNMRFLQQNQNIKNNTLESSTTHQHPHQQGHHFLNLQQQQQQQNPRAETISSIPSATEVVRSALSRSNSQISVNQLNKTINLAATSPSPYPSSPTTPTHQLKAASPSLSPSPSSSPTPRHGEACAPTYPTYPRTQQPAALHGTRIIPATQSQQHNTTTKPLYSSAQPSQTQQLTRGQTHPNQASIREFNELDSLLKSLSPGVSSSHTTHITPGYYSQPAQPSIGYGASQPTYSTGPQQHRQDQSSLYARVNKQPTRPYQAPLQQLHQNPQATHQHVGPGFTPAPVSKDYTIDVTQGKDEGCEQRQKLSSYEAPIEILPSMEDYQNITRLNPVKNHYWYKPNMSREQAISLLKDKPQGTFIVRDSTSFRGAFGLAVKVARLPPNVTPMRDPNGDPSNEFIRHFLIEPAANGVRLKGYSNEPVFNNLPNLIYQHSLTELALPCKLIIPRADIEDPQFVSKQKQFFDEFLVSKEQAKHMPYERTGPNGGYRKYPGDVYIHNEHRVVFQ